ncbi:hypothetical protein AGMMS50293_15990 [Spirochaetia bacterium]|nr:hypothetical protein AGMMS50293_15990 [Spirochaetia bacterium]
MRYELGYPFTRISRNHLIKDEQRRRIAEIDLMLENGDYVMIVEVKSVFSIGDVKARPVCGRADR